jgi:glycosyltransferase involved in cell wall biosynthesis
MGEKDHSDVQLAGEGGLSYVTRASIDAVRRASADPAERAALLADVCRLNTLYMIMQAGSGHIGSSFSSTDLITWLWTEDVRPLRQQADTPLYHQTADEFALSSDFDNSPNVTLEAMASALPVVTTDVGGVGEFVSDRVGGAVAPAGMRWRLRRPR